MRCDSLLRIAIASLLNAKAIPRAFSDVQQTWLTTRLEDQRELSTPEMAGILPVVLTWYEAHMPKAALVLQLMNTPDPPWRGHASTEGFIKVMEIGELVLARQQGQEEPKRKDEADGDRA